MGDALCLVHRHLHLQLGRLHHPPLLDLPLQARGEDDLLQHLRPLVAGQVEGVKLEQRF